MKKLSYSLLLLLFVSVAMAGCTSFVKQPIVTVKDLSVVSVDGGGAGMELYLGITNPNAFDVKLLGYNYDLKVMALPLAKGGLREEINFPSRAETDVRIPIKISFGSLLEILKRRPNFDAIPYQLSAGLDLDTPLGQMAVPVNRSGTYAIPKQYRPSSILNRLSDLLGR
ncbi:MAG TPA: LEA type 2 family protein [Geomonas sp.]|nr:LEA type 2 family protein [Geomonas sp.]